MSIIDAKKYLCIDGNMKLHLYKACCVTFIPIKTSLTLAPTSDMIYTYIVAGTVVQR